jgi:hypothetical protein
MMEAAISATLLLYAQHARKLNCIRCNLQEHASDDGRANSSREVSTSWKACLKLIRQRSLTNDRNVIIRENWWVFKVYNKKSLRTTKCRTLLQVRLGRTRVVLRRHFTRTVLHRGVQTDWEATGRSRGQDDTCAHNSPPLYPIPSHRKAIPTATSGTWREILTLSLHAVRFYNYAKQRVVLAYPSTDYCLLFPSAY